MADDLRYALRVLTKNPGYAAVAIATLGLGIGGTAAMFSAFYAVLLAPLPYRNANAIVVPVSLNAARGIDRSSVPYADYLDWREQRDIFERVSVWQPVRVDVAAGDTPERVESGQVSNEYFDVLGVTPLLGRTFRPEEHDLNAPRVAVISYGLWQRALGGSGDVIGRQIRIGGVSTSVVGVLGPHAVWPNEQELWTPLKPAQFDEPGELTRRDNMIFQSIARLNDRVPLETGRARVRSIAARIAADHPEARMGWTSDLVPLREYVVERELRDALIVLLAAVAVVLLIVCVNVANLLLARGTSRARELAVRTALGAGRLRLIRQLLTENLVVAALGGAIGLAVAVGVIRALAALAPQGVPFVAEMALNVPVLIAAAALTLASVALFGILPAMANARQQPAASLKEDGAGTGTARGTRRVRDGLVVVEVALAVVLLVTAGLLVRSFGRIVSRDAGVDVDHVVAAQLSLPRARYADDARRVLFYDTLTRDLAALPGVRAAAATSYLPAGGGGFGLGRVFLIEGQPEPPAGIDYEAYWNVITPDYFRTLGIPVVAGRPFNENDTGTSTPVAIVNEALARRMFPRGNAIGRRIRSWRDENVLREIVAVVGDVRYFGLADSDRALVYVPHRQDVWGSMTVAVRTAGAPAALASALRRTINRLDPNLGVGKLGTLAQFARASVARERFSALLLAGFAAVAVLLAAVGIYGVMAYIVALRRRELGVRAALGASPRELFALVMRHGFMLTGIGVVIGIVGALAAGRALSSLLYGVSSGDPLTFAVAVVILPLIALLACAAPGFRAARVDPIVTLRSQ